MMRGTPPMSGFTRIFLVAIIAMAVCVPAESALAHALLVKAEPPRRAVLAKPPAQVRLWFNEEIEGDYASLAVLDDEQHPVTDMKPHLAPDDPKSIVLTLPELAAGKYSVKFRVLSVDGHVVDSSFEFTVKNTVQTK
ncbi:MAG TPA: copper resistance CopC family protein [Nitrospira sp.]|nr:copper resistance CopC family protein [Nitrospira sp.]